MGKKFDAKLPFMSDEELEHVDERTLNPVSKMNLAKERERRKKVQEVKHTRTGFIRWLIGLLVTMVGWLFK